MMDLIVFMIDKICKLYWVKLGLIDEVFYKVIEVVLEIVLE